MTAHSLYDELKSWQAGIGALLGFIALLVGALWNFHLNRRRDAALRSEEAISIAAAIYGEITLLRVEAAALARVVSNVALSKGTQRDPTIKFDQHFVAAHQMSEPVLYAALAAKVGTVPPELITGISEFYKNIREARHWFPLLIEDPDRGYVYGVSQVLVPLRDAVLDVIPTLRRIEQMAGIQETARVLDLGKAEGLIAMDEDWKEQTGAE